MCGWPCTCVCRAVWLILECSTVPGSSFGTLWDLNECKATDMWDCLLFVNVCNAFAWRKEFFEVPLVWIFCVDNLGARWVTIKLVTFEVYQSSLPLWRRWRLSRKSISKNERKGVENYGGSGDVIWLRERKQWGKDSRWSWRGQNVEPLFGNDQDGEDRVAIRGTQHVIG